MSNNTALYQIFVAGSNSPWKSTKYDLGGLMGEVKEIRKLMPGCILAAKLVRPDGTPLASFEIDGRPTQQTGPWHGGSAAMVPARIPSTTSLAVTVDKAIPLARSTDKLKTTNWISPTTAVAGKEKK